MGGEAAVLFANEAFYTAFQTRDISAMEAIWAEDAPVACVHPGWHALTTREEVMESWQDILSSDSAPAIVCRGAQAFVSGDSAFVVCYEQIGDNLLVASNLFRREAGGWKIVHHHAGPCNLAPEALEEEPEQGMVQ